MLFKCNKCGIELDFDEDDTVIVECWNYPYCDGDMYPITKEGEVNGKGS